MSKRSYLHEIREVARRIAKRQDPEGENRFDEFWDLMKESLSRWPKKRPEKWTSRVLQKEMAASAGYRGKAVSKEKHSLIIISTVAGVLYHLGGYSSRTDEAEIRRLVQEYGVRYGISGREIGEVSQIIFHLQALWLDSAMEAQSERASRVKKKRSITSEPLVVEVGCDDGRPCVRFNDAEAEIFRSREYAFAMFSFLAAARRSGPGWLHKIDDLQGASPHTQEFYKLRAEYLGALSLKRLIQASGRKDGKVRLDHPQESIIVQNSLSEFVSVHQQNIIGLLSFLSQEKIADSQILDNLEQESYRLGRNSTLVQQALKQAQRDLIDMSWKDAMKRAYRYLDSHLAIREEQAEGLRELLE